MSQPRSYATAPPPGTPAGSATAATGPASGNAVAPAGATGQQLASSPDQQALGQGQNDTPRRLRLLTTALILVGLLFGVAGAVSFAGMAASLERAEANTDQLIRVQQIQTNLLSADATATSAFLVGGLEPPAQRSAYDQAVAATGRLIAQASDAQPADAAALSRLNQSVVNYAVSIEQARANNRQGFPVGAAYLRNASSTLRSDALPILDNLVSANSTRAADEMDSRIGWLFGIVGLLALAALVTAMVWVARRFKRWINVGLLSAGLLVLLSWVAGVVVLAQVGSQVNGIQQGSFSSVNSAAAARIQANNAKSNESLTLIARGSGATFEQAWAASAGQVDSRLASVPGADLARAWTPYKMTHQQIRKLDDGGSWDAAVALTTGSGATSSNVLFGRFDAAATTFLDDASEETSTGLAAPQALLVVLAILTFLAGVGAALLARWGLAERLREYR